MPSLMDLAVETRLEILRYLIPKQLVVEDPLNELIPANPALPLLLVNSTLNAEVRVLPQTVLVVRFTSPHESPLLVSRWAKIPRSQFWSPRLLVEFVSASELDLTGVPDAMKQQLLRHELINNVRMRNSRATRALIGLFRYVDILRSEKFARLDNNFLHSLGVQQWHVSDYKGATVGRLRPRPWRK